VATHTRAPTPRTAANQLTCNGHTLSHFVNLDAELVLRAVAYDSRQLQTSARTLGAQEATPRAL
jgi:hypothetical protein